MKVHVYERDNINTDEIIPARYLQMDREEELAPHAMEDLDADFAARVRRGDAVVAGSNFGCGSSREHAVWALRGAGVRAVIADSFARIFYRNCINNGFPAIECPGLHKALADGDEIDISADSGEIRIRKSGEVRRFIPLPPFARGILRAGGLMKKIGQERQHQD
jgi:3-isopropylmalate/(R)-2-methylmalate dehydratase small subunit